MNNFAARLLFLLLFASLVGAQEAVTSTYTIQYTGRTFGYARIPDLQTVNTAPAGDASKAADAYKELFSKAKPEGPMLRLGMGDNFAPNLFARVFRMPATSVEKKGGKGEENWCHPDDPDILVPKDRFFFDSKTKKWWCANTGPDQDANGKTTMDYDNVAQFFIANKYNALVPGKHDFYFGPERLRDVARLLGTGGVHMLGANLFISTTRSPQVLNAYPRIPNRYAGLKYGTDFGPVSIDLPEIVFPYKRQFVIKNARQVLFRIGNGLVPPAQLSTLARKDVSINPLVTDVQICAETAPAAPSDPNNIPLPDAPHSNCMPLVAGETACAMGSGLGHLRSSCMAIYKGREDGIFDAATNPSNPSADETYLFQEESAELTPGANYLMCMHLSGIAREKWTCQPFSVQMPFFTWGLGKRPSGEKGSDIRMPYELVGAGTQRIAVFGVIDPDLLSNVGLVNYGWLNNSHALDTVVKVAPADSTLKQALDLCNSQDDCRKARKVVMAQMSWAKAGQLIARFGDQFDLAISQADDDHDTGDRKVTSPTPAKTRPRLLITPPNPAVPDGAFTPKVSSAKVSIVESGRGDETQVSWSLVNSVDAHTAIPDDLPRCDSPSCITVGDASQAALVAAKALPAKTGTPQARDVSDLALSAMRKALKSDIAFLQKRDLYYADALSSAPIMQKELQNQLQRIFWKGDFVTRFHTTGATLRKIMKQSKKFADLDRDALSTEVELGRDLLTLGLDGDPKDSDTMYVNGALLDDAALYSVVATQYLGLGDTGYADFATPDVPPPYRIEDFETLRPIAGLVCAAIEETHQYQEVKCDKAVLRGDDYFDPSNARPFDETSGFDAGSHYWTLGKRLFTDGSVPTTGLKGTAQQRGFFAVNLENLDLAYAGTYVNHVHTAGATFLGISAPGVTTTGSNSLAADHRLRAIYDFRHGTFYGLSDSTFMRTSTTASGVPTIASNMAGFEGGGTIRLFAPKRPAWLSLQYSSRFEGQLTAPSPILVNVPADLTQTPAKPATSFLLPSPQISTLSGRLGLRFDHADTYLETGFEQIDSRHILSQYQFSDGTTCGPLATLQLPCVNSAGKQVAISDPSLTISSPPSPKVITTDYLTGGAYLNFNIKFPLWSRRDANRVDQSWYFTLSNRGDFYFNSRNDTSTQTRYLDKFTPSFSIPVYGKLSLSPKVDFILLRK